MLLINLVELVYFLASLLRLLLWDSWFFLRLDSLRLGLRVFLRVVVVGDEWGHGPDNLV